MKTLYEIKSKHYQSNTFGVFEDQNLAKELCQQINDYNKKNKDSDRAYLSEVNVFEKGDKLYCYYGKLNLQNPEDIVMQSIVPSYNPSGLEYTDIQITIEKIEDCELVTHVSRYGATEEEVMDLLKNDYQKLHCLNLLEQVNSNVKLYIKNKCF